MISVDVPGVHSNNLFMFSRYHYIPGFLSPKLTTMSRKNYRERKMKYFTPPSTFDNLWMEFHQSVPHVKNVLLDFIMALSKILKAMSAILNILCEVIELLVHFVLTVVNGIWLVIKIVLVMGETIKAMGPQEPSKVQKNLPSDGNNISASPDFKKMATPPTDPGRKNPLLSGLSGKDSAIQPASSRKDSSQPDNNKMDYFKSDNIKKDSFQDSFQSDSDKKESKSSVQFDLSKNIVHLDSNSDNVVALDLIKRNSLTFTQDKKITCTSSNNLNSITSKTSVEGHRSWRKSLH